MARSGRRLRCLRAGHLIVMDTGCGLRLGAGPGLTTRLGDSLPSTTVAGCTGTTHGVGRRDRWVIGIPTMRRRWSAGSAELALAGAGEVLASASALAGSR